MNQEEKAKKNSKTLGVIIGMIAFAIAFMGVKYLFKNDITLELKKGAIELNKLSPQQVDDYTRLDSAASIGKTNFIYYYTLLSLEKSEVNLDTVNKYLRPEIIKGVKENVALKVFRKNNITMDYKYYDKNGEFAMEISVTPDLYK
ncbi:hypothetical protein H9W90_14500 [Polaribacter pectinis]|uniref:Uncharacterized protein n=1 Tax=Polaribacter pectinis TaxID=2738844 RepID=A0A7G9L9S9_9FLAO|nr:hypothetical protein [Polaribacter pectinis]QNM85378.1 hypothetical protein H9W90_14500 [Polaribacter pectinis]